MTFAIAHDESSGRGGASAGLVWRTCLRDVAFARDESELGSAGARFVDGDAYTLMLEILCGLRSPLVGETEVLGQFKHFLSSVSTTSHGWLHAIARRLLADARDVRAAHLVGLGSRTYGSAVRRYLADSPHVALIGTGALGRELLPFLGEDGRAVDVWGRRATCPLTGVGPEAYRRIEEVDPPRVSPHKVSIVVAAPVPATAIVSVAYHYAGLDVVVDLRGEPAREPIGGTTRVVTLENVFESMREATEHTAGRVARAKQDIDRRSTAFATRMDLRPFGWDDLCA